MTAVLWVALTVLAAVTGVALASLALAYRDNTHLEQTLAAYQAERKQLLGELREARSEVWQRRLDADLARDFAAPAAPRVVAGSDLTEQLAYQAIAGGDDQTVELHVQPPDDTVIDAEFFEIVKEL